MWDCLVHPIIQTTCLFFQQLLVNLCYICLSHHCYWERESLSVQHMSVSSQRLNAVMVNPWAFCLSKHPWWDILWQDTSGEYLLTWWELWEAKEPPSNKVQLKLEVWIDLWHLLPNKDRDQRLLKVDFYNAGISYYMRMPTNSPLVDPKGEKPAQLCKEGDNIVKPTFPMTEIQLSCWEGWVCVLE